MDLKVFLEGRSVFCVDSTVVCTSSHSTAFVIRHALCYNCVFCDTIMESNSVSYLMKTYETQLVTISQLYKPIYLLLLYFIYA